ncbi:hypothetical protein [Chitinophaga sp. YIM B06452]|uniref:hypothetical protein n=1 Tax=Chitinophaga sp. YIM B06452 TaxID=3082158 RepID=UPI0031FF02A5
MALIKLSPTQALTLIKQLGVDAELVAEEQAEKDLKFDDAITAVDESRSRIFKPGIETALKAQLTTQLAGQFGGALRATLRRLSNGQLKTSDLQDLKDDEAIQKFLDIMVSSKDSSLDDIRAQMKKNGEDWEKEKAGLLAQEKQKYDTLVSSIRERDADAIYERIVSEIPRTGGNAKVQAQALKAYVRSLYKDHYDDNKKDIELRDLSNPEKPALKGNLAVVLKDVGTEWAKESGILKNDNRTEDPNKTQEQRDQGQKTHTTQYGGGSFQKDMAAFEDQLNNAE